MHIYRTILHIVYIMLLYIYIYHGQYVASVDSTKPKKKMTIPSCPGPSVLQWDRRCDSPGDAEAHGNSRYPLFI